MPQIKIFLKKINLFNRIFNKIINRKIKIKYVFAFLITFSLLLGLIKLTITLHKGIDKASEKSPQIIKIQQKKDSKPQNNIVANNSIVITIEYGKNIFAQFVDSGFSPEEVRQVINELNLYYDIRKLRPGNKFIITYDAEFYYEEKTLPLQSKEKLDKDKKKNQNNNTKDNILTMEAENITNESIQEKIFEKKEKRKIKNLFFKDVSNNKKITIKFNEELNKFETSVINVPLTKEIKLEKIVIKNSIFSDAISALSSQVIYKILNEYAFSVDFQRDIQKNDTLIVLIEYIIDDEGNKKEEKILYSNLILSKKNNEIFRFKDNFYNKEGKSSSKSLLLSPVDGARISSKFTLNRRHPVLGYSRAHLGVDFAAPVGTPIYASGDGTITFTGWKGGCGKMVSIRHNSEFSTNYCHMSKFNKRSKPGSRVKQREIIGYIGVTGLSNGPHLHYELIKNGKKINPRSIKGISSKKLTNQEMDLFKQTVLETEDIINKKMLKS